MHTLAVLSAADFGITVDGWEGTIADVFEDFTLDDRLAVVATADGGALGAAMTILATVTEYYRQLADQESGFYAYPDVYVVHVGRRRGWHGMLDVWSEHKEVVVPSAGEPLLTALTDRRITRVLLPPGPLGEGTLMRESLDRLRRQVRTAWQYGADVPAVTVSGSGAARDLVAAAAEATTRLLGSRPAVDFVDRLARVDVDRLPSRLLGLVDDREHVGMSEEYQRDNGITPAVLARHAVRI